MAEQRQSAETKTRHTADLLNNCSRPMTALGFNFNLHDKGYQCLTSLPIIQLLTHIGHKFIHSFGMCRMQRFLVDLRSFFHSSLLCTFSCHPSPPTICPSSLTLSCHLFLGLPLNPAVPKFIYNTLLGILFPSTLCTCPNQRNLFNLIVSVIVGFLTLG